MIVLISKEACWMCVAGHTCCCWVQDHPPQLSSASCYTTPQQQPQTATIPQIQCQFRRRPADSQRGPPSRVRYWWETSWAPAPTRIAAPPAAHPASDNQQAGPSAVSTQRQQSAFRGSGGAPGHPPGPRQHRLPSLRPPCSSAQHHLHTHVPPVHTPSLTSLTVMNLQSVCGTAMHSSA